MDQFQKEFGKHFLVEFTECNVDKIKYVGEVEQHFLAAAERSGAKILKSHFHQFEPEGVTGIILIAWSHFSVHTWPEDQYVAFDVLTCGEMDAELAISELEKGFEAKGKNVRVFSRGY